MSLGVVAKNLFGKHRIARWGYWAFRLKVIPLFSMSNLRYRGVGLVTVKTSNFALELDLRDRWSRKVFESIKKNGYYEPSNTLLIKGNLRIGGVFVDVGANLGYFTVLAAKIVGPQGKVYAFEPYASAAKQLATNLMLNGVTNVELTRKAASSKTGFITLYASGDDISLANTSGPLGPGFLGTQVETIRIDDELAEDIEVDIVKMDIEGGEFDALLGMTKTINRSKNLRLVIEYNASARDARKIGFNLFEFLNRQFEVYKVEPRGGSEQPALVGPVHAPEAIRERLCTLWCVRRQ